jgi:hypothetical protein
MGLESAARGVVGRDRVRAETGSLLESRHSRAAASGRVLPVSGLANRNAADPQPSFVVRTKLPET